MSTPLQFCCLGCMRTIVSRSLLSTCRPNEDDPTHLASRELRKELSDREKITVLIPANPCPKHRRHDGHVGNPGSPRAAHGKVQQETRKTGSAVSNLSALLPTLRGRQALSTHARVCSTFESEYIISAVFPALFELFPREQ